MLHQSLQFTPEQQRWLDRIREHMRTNLSIDREDFDRIAADAKANCPVSQALAGIEITLEATLA